MASNMNNGQRKDEEGENEEWAKTINYYEIYKSFNSYNLYQTGIIPTCFLF